MMSINTILWFVFSKFGSLSIIYLIIVIIMMILRKKEKNKAVLILGIITLCSGILHFLVFNVHIFETMMELFKTVYITAFVIFIV